ncbi:hypothetical protein SAMN02745116_01420 [Pilibacter termitis]|uniref:Uncharacterized protein n=1 Tax=Pilibacter termitis TaxID=263852 RepID=A0A1T4NG28_9ENTE|nr:hypothetical protein [Pilibacter termitis]SJZ78105.1 hypothetical protein SAMN02745116_01420 [Pilibacter termitis]
MNTVKKITSVILFALAVYVLFFAHVSRTIQSNDIEKIAINNKKELIIQVKLSSFAIVNTTFVDTSTKNNEKTIQVEITKEYKLLNCLASHNNTVTIPLSETLLEDTKNIKIKNTSKMLTLNK